MSKFSKYAAKPGTSTQREAEKVRNFMDGVSFTVNPIDTLKMVAASSIFGEPAYYRPGDLGRPSSLSKLIGSRQYDIFKDRFPEASVSTADVMTRAIDSALSYDFGQTMELAVELRNDYYMRLNPAVIMVRAAIHPERYVWTGNNPGGFADTVARVARRPDDLTTMVEYYIATQGGKQNMPSILKNSIARRLESYDQFQLAKYQNRGIGLVDVVRITHANNPLIDDLMGGTLSMPQGRRTWMQARSEGASWKEIWQDPGLRLSHFDLLKQMRRIFEEVSDPGLAREILDQFLAGVEGSMVFPFRYWSAWNVVKDASSINMRPKVMDTLQIAIDRSVSNLPTLSGRTAALSDNSGSAHGGFIAEGSRTTVAEIDNLSSVIAGMASDEGYVGVFGDRLEMIPVSHRDGALTQADYMQRVGRKIGAGTEHGIWLFWERAISRQEHWDNVFIFSDQQAGHGGLYGRGVPREWTYASRGGWSREYIDVMKLVDAYRKRVNPQVNVFTVQTAGYDNSVLPENIYRGAILAGWTGKEIQYAHELDKIWSEVEQGQ